MLVVLDALRGLAALFVVLHHAYSLLWRSETFEAAVQAQAVPAWLLTLVNPLDFGRQAVMLFFVLSGFCIHYRQATALAAWDRRGPAPSLSWPTFAWRRLTRLYPVLLFAIVLTLVLDAAGSSLNPSLYAEGLGWSRSVRLGLHIAPPTLDILAANLLMQAEIVRPHLGSNGPLWSLSMEFWFYAFYPAFLWLTTKFGPTRALRLVSIASLVGLMVTGVATSVPVWLAGKVVTYWVVWVAGAVIAEAFAKRQRLHALNWLGPVSLVAMAYMLFFGRTDERIVYDLCWSAVLAVALAYLLLCLPLRAASGVEALARRFEPLGRISYSLYATHYPLMVLTAALWLRSHPALPTDPSLAAFGIVASLVLGCATWWAVERRTTRARKAPVAQAAPSSPYALTALRPA